jgi:LmbE family N-acetylglucosaminyl deacetylase
LPLLYTCQGRGASSAPHPPHARSTSLHILVLSPHRNDAAFSLGLALEGWLAAKHRVTILGVFTRSATAPFSDADTVHPNDLLSYVSGMRRKEDAELLKLLPKLRMEDLNLKDAPIRLRCIAGEEYTREPSAEDSAVAKIHKALAKLDSEKKIDAVLLPLGLGHHVDHLVVRNAALEFSATRACAFYEDLPDALRDGESFDASRDIDSAIEAELAAMGGSFTPVVPKSSDETSIKRKLKMVSAYASQIDEPTMQIISNFASGERVWANAAWLALGLGA